MNIINKKKFKRRLKQGFNLMETIIWIGIVSILTGIISISSVTLMQNHKVNTANQELMTYQAALLQYYNLYSNFPGQDEGLMALVNNKIIDIPHKKKELDPAMALTDPWNNPYVYLVLDDGQGYTLKTLGSDKKEGGNGTAKDIVITTGESIDESTESKEFKPGKIE